MTEGTRARRNGSITEGLAPSCPRQGITLQSRVFRRKKENSNTHRITCYARKFISNTVKIELNKFSKEMADPLSIIHIP